MGFDWRLHGHRSYGPSRDAQGPSVDAHRGVAIWGTVFLGLRAQEPPYGDSLDCWLWWDDHRWGWLLILGIRLRPEVPPVIAGSSPTQPKPDAAPNRTPEPTPS